MADIFDIYRTRIKEILKQSGKAGLAPGKLYAKCKGKKCNRAAYDRALGSLIKEGIVYEGKKTIKLAEEKGFFKAEVARISRTFGFIRREDGDDGFFHDARRIRR